MLISIVIQVMVARYLMRMI